jgi:hypothetical protein
VVVDDFSKLPGKTFLEGFFKRCDRIRFSGNEINTATTQALLTDLRSFLSALGKARREGASA